MMTRYVLLLGLASLTSAATAQSGRKVLEIPWVPAPERIVGLAAAIGKPASTAEGAAMICAKREVPGSRINVNKECHTKAEWY